MNLSAGPKSRHARPLRPRPRRRTDDRAQAQARADAAADEPVAQALRLAQTGTWHAEGGRVRFDATALHLLGRRRADWVIADWLATLDPAEAVPVQTLLTAAGRGGTRSATLNTRRGALLMCGGRASRGVAAGVLLPLPFTLADVPAAPAPLLIGDARHEDRDALFVGISHELRTPLHAIHGFAQLARSDPSPEAGRQYLEPIEQSSRLMLRVVTDLLDLARLEAGKLDIDPDQPLSLPALITRVCAQALALRGEQPVRLYGVVDPRCPAHVRADGGRLEQVLMNLVGNALKFTPVGEVVVAVKLRRLRDGIATVSWSVADTGIGIPAQHLGRLGQAFERGGAPGSGRGSGTGLGLALVRRLLDLHGTRLRVASVSGGGTLMGFDLDLPVDSLAPAESPIAETAVFSADRRLHETLATQWRAHGQAVRPPSLAARARRWVIDVDAPDAGGRLAQARAEGREVLAVHAGPATGGGVDVAEACALPLASQRVFGDDSRRQADAEPSLQGHSVLVVEDNPLSQQVLLEFLGRLGLRVRVAGDGAAACQAVARERFDLAILDIQLPDTTGFDCARALQALPFGCTLPLVFLSAQAGPEEQLQASAVGARACLGKPFEAGRLRRLLRQMLQPGVRADVVDARRDGAAPDVRSGAVGGGAVGASAPATAHASPVQPGIPANLQALFRDQWRALRPTLLQPANPTACAAAAHQLRASFALLNAPAGVAAARALEEALAHGESVPPPLRDTVLAEGDRLAG